MSDPGWISAEDASALLGVKKETLYAYVSRGRVQSVPQPGSRARFYSRADLEGLRAASAARRGHGPVAASALSWGEPVLDSAVSEITPRGPVYRGRLALELAREGVSFERVAELLFSGSLPARVRWLADGAGVSPSKLAALTGRSPRSLELLVCAAAALGLAARASHRVGALRADGELPAARALILRLTALLATPRGGRAVDAALAESSVARAWLVAMGARPRPSAVRAVDRALVLMADHELNPSTFAARVAAATGADLWSCFAAALATLSGPEHGGATDRVEALFDEIDAPERAVSVVRERLARGEPVPGFGHRLYPAGDPRGALLLEEATRLSPARIRVRIARALVDAMDLATGMRPTSDVGLVALSDALGLGGGAPLALFAIGRTAGFVAHIMEQRESGRPLRPRARYVARTFA